MDAQTTLEYRRALSAFPTGVALITVTNGEGPVGLVANSFTSLSLEPPLVLWCLGDRSDRGAYFRDAERYTVNILGARAEDLARRYAERGRHHLEPDDLAPSAQGVVVKGAASVLHCRAAERIHLADHLLIVGQVEAFEILDGTGDGLTYFRSRFGRAAALE